MMMGYPQFFTALAGACWQLVFEDNKK